jgi:hypothetical protein
MRWSISTTLVPLTLLVGCVWDPVVYQVRIRPEIDRVQDRTLSMQLVTPQASNPERVIHRGELISAKIENSDDTPSDFVLGMLIGGVWNRGSIRLLIHESGVSQSVLLGKPPTTQQGLTLWLIATVPTPPAQPSVNWKSE